MLAVTACGARDENENENENVVSNEVWSREKYRATGEAAERRLRVG